MTPLRFLSSATCALAIAAPDACLIAQNGGASLVGRAVLPGATFLPGPTCGQQVTGSTNGVPVPFLNQQPVQGFSAIHDNGDGTYLAMSDNGFGSIENSADYLLRVYRIRPNFQRATGGLGTIDVLSWLELSDPNNHVPFAITNQFTLHRKLTGADFDLESMAVAADGTLWFGDEFGPFLLHTDAQGRLLEAPIPLPDFDQPGRDLRSPQSPLSEEASAIRIMNAMRADARRNGNTRDIVFSPWHVMLDDSNASQAVPSRVSPPAGSGLQPANSDVFNVRSLQSAGFPVVCWTVNDSTRMTELMRLRVNGIISDRPDLLYQAVAAFDANGDNVPGDWLLPDGRIDSTRFDAQGHRGGRDLRPENTLPAIEVALDNLMTTLEFDCGVTLDRIAVLDHDPSIQSQKARRADGQPYGRLDEVLVRDLTLQQIQQTFIADRLFRGPSQQNDLQLSPVSVAFANSIALPHPYAMPSLQQVFDFVQFYVRYYQTGAGSSHPQAGVRARNASLVRFNVETKINPRQEFAWRTLPPNAFVDAIAGVIQQNGLALRADVQSFDFRSLLGVHARFPMIRTVCLFGDFPIFDDPMVPGSDDGTNLQTEYGFNTPWLAGMYWPYRQTRDAVSFRVPVSRGFEGMALSTDRTKLYPLLEGALVGGVPRTLLIHEFDLLTRRYTGVRWSYPLDVRGAAIGDFVMFSSNRGLVIERDNSQGQLGGFKRVFEIELPHGGGAVTKVQDIDLMAIADPNGLSLPALPGDVGLGNPFAMPFVTIEGLVVYDRRTIGVLNDNNFPFSVGRHVGSGQPDDNEFVLLQLSRPLGECTGASGQPNSAAAWLSINGFGDNGCRGPHAFSFAAGSPVTFDWRGPANGIAVLVLGPRNPHARELGCFGIQDIGFPPFTDLVTIGIDFLDAAGRLRQVGQVPAGLPVGTTADFQGAVTQSAGCEIVLTAALYGETR